MDPFLTLQTVYFHAILQKLIFFLLQFKKYDPVFFPEITFSFGQFYHLTFVYFQSEHDKAEPTQSMCSCSSNSIYHCTLKLPSFHKI